MRQTVGIGIIGAGQVTQSIHLPAIATVNDRCEIRWIMDIHADVAKNVAGRVEARATTSIEPILEDPKVDVIVICSPNSLHCEQILAACAASKKAILCEKPLAWSQEEARLIDDAIRPFKTALFVGTMHVYDPACRRAIQDWKDHEEQASLIQSSICIPANSVFIAQSTEIFAHAAPAASRPADSQKYRRAMLRSALLGLGIHDIPLVRELCADPGTLHNVAGILPYGYALNMANDLTRTMMTAITPGEWPARWMLKATGKRTDLHIEFTPSYVLGGSSKAHIVRNGVQTTFHSDLNGYEVLWQEILDVVTGRSEQTVPPDIAIADLDFALGLAGAADRILEERL